MREGGAKARSLEVDPCEAAKFNSIDYFSTQDFGIIIQSSIFRDKNSTFLNNQVFFNTIFLKIKTMEYFSTQIFKYITKQRKKKIILLNYFFEQE